jgi:hypothetical protein
MSPKANQPVEPTGAETGRETKRRYQSGPTPPRMPKEPKPSRRDERESSSSDEVASFELQNASREQLDQKARELNIVGFEEMSNEELVKRIREAR